jgi:glycosyltransferase involved in cell wall biosynthesis
VSVVHFFPQELPPATAATDGVPGPFFLAVGELTRRKDYPTMFAAFARAGLAGYRLVVVGPAGYGAEEIRAAAAASGLGDRLILIGLVSDERLAALYDAATALCLTSREEGFGMPMVEAMQRGLPIIASGIPVVNEIAGDAAVTADVGDVDGFASAMAAVASDAGLRERLRAAALRRGRDFGAEATVDGILAVYRRVVES